MQRDFTEAAFEELLATLLAAGYRVLPFEPYLRAGAPAERIIILRHDVDKRPGFSVRLAEIEARLGILGTFYFRIVPESFDEAAILRIAGLGHEIGYHYEDLALAGGDEARAIALFESHLRKLRSVCPISTLCMHGSPLSAHDNRRLWSTYDYRAYDLIGEPYFDVDFTRVRYLTDTGRRWDGAAVSVRDKVVGAGSGMHFRSTYDILAAARAGRLPEQIMITVHPQRWSDSLPVWTLELVGQRIKNVAKGALNVARRAS